MLFTVDQQTSQVLREWKGKYWLAKTKADPGDRAYKRALVYQVQPELVAVTHLHKSVDQSSVFCNDTMLPNLKESAEECIASWSVDPHRCKPTTSSTVFSMAPPSSSPTYPETPMKPSDPLEFIYAKYFDALYSFNTPLSYFPKMALSRFKVHCDKNSDVAKAHLLQLILPQDVFQKRHEGPYGLLRHTTVTNSRNPTLEETYRQKIWDLKLDASINNVTEDKTSAELEHTRSIAAALKVREVHLQIILIFEALDCANVQEEQLLATKKEQEHSAFQRLTLKKSLVRKRKARKKVVPTFLGMGVTVDDNIPSQAASLGVTQESDLLATLDTLIENLTLWDTLDNSRIKKKETSLGFLAYVLVPFFNKRLPEITKYVVDKIKPQERPTSRPRMALAEPHEQPPSEKEPSKVTKSSRYQKVHLAPQNNPNLRSSMTISGNENLLPALSLRRSKSNLSSKNLQKRQVDMSFPKPETKEKRKRLKRLQSMYDQPLENESIFGNAKRAVKSFAVDLDTIAATPIKPKVSQISETPRDTFDLKPGIQFATPEEFVVEPVTSGGKSMMRNLSEKLHAATSSTGVQDSLSSPVGINHVISSSVERRELVKTPKDSLVVTSPQRLSQRLSTKRRPGEPISVQESPFFHTSLNGSPTSGRMFGNITRRKR